MEFYTFVAILALGFSLCAATISILMAFRVYRMECIVERIQSDLGGIISPFPTFSEKREEEDEEDRPAFLKRQAE